MVQVKCEMYRMQRKSINQQTVNDVEITSLCFPVFVVYSQHQYINLTAMCKGRKVNPNVGSVVMSHHFLNEFFFSVKYQISFQILLIKKYYSVMIGQQWLGYSIILFFLCLSARYFDPLTNNFPKLEFTDPPELSSNTTV